MTIRATHFDLYLTEHAHRSFAVAGFSGVKLDKPDITNLTAPQVCELIQKGGRTRQNAVEAVPRCRQQIIG